MSIYKKWGRCPCASIIKTNKLLETYSNLVPFFIECGENKIQCYTYQGVKYIVDWVNHLELLDAAGFKCSIRQYRQAGCPLYLMDFDGCLFKIDIKWLDFTKQITNNCVITTTYAGLIMPVL